MRGPQDVPGECNAHLSIGDDFGDNSATMRCSLKAGHDGKHREEWGEGCVVEWIKDMREPPCEHDWEHHHYKTCRKCHENEWPEAAQ